MDTNIQQVLSSAQSILIVLPANPRLDFAASALGLASSLGKSGKSASVICSSPMTVELSRLVGVEKVTNRPGNKNLVVHFVDYDVKGIDTVTYDIESGQFELLVTIKDGFTPPATSQVQLNYSGVNADVILMVGVVDPNQLGLENAKELFESNKLAYLGFNPPRVSSPLLFSLTDPAAASTSEVVVNLLESLSLPFDRDVASNLLFGIETATNNFLTNATSANTFEAAAICLRHGATRHSQEIRSANQPQNPLRGQRDQRDQRPPRQFPQTSPRPQVQIPTPLVPVEAQPAPPEVIQNPNPAPASQPPQPSAQPVSTPPIISQPTTFSPSSQPQVQPINIPKQEPPSPEWLEPKIYTGRTIV